MITIVRSRTCDGCGVAMTMAEGVQLPAVPPLDCCSDACVSKVVGAVAAGRDLPATSADASTARAAKTPKGPTA